MSDVRIDRLNINLSGLDEVEGRRLATLVTEGLAAADLSAGAFLRLESIRLDLRAGPRAGLDELAAQIVNGLVREIARST
ncbi:MAG: hypothetical protein QM820_35225 [Minicystis sp.]